MRPSLSERPRAESQQRSEFEGCQKRVLAERRSEQLDLESRIDMTVLVQPRQVAVESACIHIDATWGKALLPKADHPCIELGLGRPCQPKAVKSLSVGAERCAAPVPQVSTGRQELLMEWQKVAGNRLKVGPSTGTSERALA